MKNSKVINVDETSPIFLADLQRRLTHAKNTKNCISLDTAKLNTTKKYRKLASTKV